MSARTLSWLAVAGLVLAVFALGGPAQAWAKATSYLHHNSAPAAGTSVVHHGGSGDSGAEEPGDP